MMKALSKLHNKKGIWQVEAPIPKPGHNDLLIKIKKTAICGTDMHIYHWDEWAQRTIPTPMIVGHEFVGEVVEVGEGVNGFSIGDRVSGEGHITCGHCRNCRAGKRHLCRNTEGVGVNRQGSFAQYLCIPAFNAFKLNECITDSQAAIFDPFGNAVHTALSFDMVGEDILITGAAGFLGSHLCDRFIKEGFEVIGMDNFITGDPSNIAHLKNHPNFEFIDHDVTEYIKINGELDYILHFASPASPIDYLKIPIQTLKVGSLGTHNLLGLAKVKQARVLIASTSEIYGDPLVHPQTEDYYGNVNTIGPRGVYDEAKRFQESITMAYHRFHGIETRIVRIFNTYGPRMRLNDGRVIPAFMGQALRGEDLTVFGDGIQTRSFCYVDDLIEGIYRLLLSDYAYPVNIGNPNEITIKDFAEEIIKLTNTKQKIIYKDLPVNDPLQRQPDISLARKILNWEPTIDREEGMLRTFNYFKSLTEEELYKSEHKDFANHIKK